LAVFFYPDIDEGYATLKTEKIVSVVIKLVFDPYLIQQKKRG
jgi:hypothetical protein